MFFAYVLDGINYAAKDQYLAGLFEGTFISGDLKITIKRINPILAEKPNKYVKDSEEYLRNYLQKYTGWYFGPQNSLFMFNYIGLNINKPEILSQYLMRYSFAYIYYYQDVDEFLDYFIATENLQMINFFVETVKYLETRYFCKRPYILKCLKFIEKICEYSEDEELQLIFKKCLKTSNNQTREFFKMADKYLSLKEKKKLLEKYQTLCEEQFVILKHFPDDFIINYLKNFPCRKYYKVIPRMIKSFHDRPKIMNWIIENTSSYEQFWKSINTISTDSIRQFKELYPSPKVFDHDYQIENRIKDLVEEYYSIPIIFKPQRIFKTCPEMKLIWKSLQAILFQEYTLLISKLLNTKMNSYSESAALFFNN